MADNPDPLFRLQWAELLPFAVAVISGAISGCAASFSAGRKSPEVLTAFFVGYAICGVFGAVMALAGAWVFVPSLIGSVPKLILFTGAAGLITSLALASSNLTMRFILKRLGVEIVIDLRRTSSEIKIDD